MEMPVGDRTLNFFTLDHATGDGTHRHSFWHFVLSVHDLHILIFSLGYEEAGGALQASL